MGRHLLVIGWIVVIVALAVVASAAVDAPSAGIRALLAVEAFHIAAHLALFAILAILLARPRPARPALAVTVFVVAAVAQEYAQTLVPGHAFTMDSVFDLGVDFAGGVLGLLALRWWGHF